MPALPLQTDAFVLLKRPPSDSFQSFSAFSPTHGPLLLLQRTAKKNSTGPVALDLFDEVALLLESSNQGQTWFIKESRLIARHIDIGRSYDALRHASALAALVVRNPVPEESRATVAALLRQAFASFAAVARSDFVWFKSLYLFARDEGYPLKEQWFPTLPSADRKTVAALLNRPLAELSAPSSGNLIGYPSNPAATGPVERSRKSGDPIGCPIDATDVSRLTLRLEEYLRGHTEILLD